MTSIDASQRLAVLLRTHVREFQARAGGTGAGKRAGSAGQSRDLASVVAKRVHSIARDDPDRKRKALRIFLESLLLDQLGQGLLKDGRFTAMVDAVQERMEADQEVAAAMAALGDVLVGTGR